MTKTDKEKRFLFDLEMDRFKTEFSDSNVIMFYDFDQYISDIENILTFQAGYSKQYYFINDYCYYITYDEYKSKTVIEIDTANKSFKMYKDLAKVNHDAHFCKVPEYMKTYSIINKSKTYLYEVYV